MNADKPRLWRAALMRNGSIALIAGGVFALFGGGLARWPIATALALWPSFGGHLVERWFLQSVRPRLSGAVLAAARVVTWFIGGIGLALGMGLTASALGGFRPVERLDWWIGGLAFVGIELIVHLAL